MKKVTVGVILFGTKYLKQSLPSLVEQDYEGEIEFVFRDQEEGKWTAYEFVEKELPEVFAKVKMIKGENIWHSGGHNLMMKEMQGEYYFCCSNDMFYTKDFVIKMLGALEEEEEYEVGTPKIMQWSPKTLDDGREVLIQSSVIDSFGIGARKYQHFFDIGQGEKDTGQFDGVKEVFGVSGACAVFAKSALEKIRYGDEFFDGLLHYKNDVDLAYRLRWAGVKSLLVTDVKVWHDRQVASHSKKSLWVKESSFFGEKILMKKNFVGFDMGTKIVTKVYHFFKTGFLLLTNPKLFKVYSELKIVDAEVQAKRKAVKRIADPEDIIMQMR